MPSLRWPRFTNRPRPPQPAVSSAPSAPREAVASGHRLRLQLLALLAGMLALAAGSWAVLNRPTRRTNLPSLSAPTILEPWGAPDPALGSTRPAQRKTRDPAGQRALEDLVRLRPRIAAMLRAREQLGPGAEGRAEALEAALLSEPGAAAALRKMHATLPPDADSARWQVVELLGRHPSPENVAFLRDLAVASSDPSRAGEDGAVHQRAALGVLAAWSAGTPSSPDALRDVLETAAPDVATTVSLELWRTGRTTPWQRQLLQARGLADRFRPLSAEEQERIRPSMNAADGAPGVPGRSGPDGQFQ